MNIELNTDDRDHIVFLLSEAADAVEKRLRVARRELCDSDDAALRKLIASYNTMAVKLSLATVYDSAKTPSDGPAEREEAIAALRRVMAVARRDTGQSARCAAFILAWFNPHGYGNWDITDIWAMDRALKYDMLRLLKFLAFHQGTYPSDFVPEDEILAIAKSWHPEKFTGQ